MKSSRRTVLTLSILVSAALSSLSLGCAGVKNNPPPNNGSGGSGGGGPTTPAIPGLVSIEVNPGSQTVPLMASTGSSLTGSATFTALGHFQDGHTEDVTQKVGWSSPFRSLRLTSGSATVTAPGTYLITVAAGTIMTTTTLIATFTGNFSCAGFDSSGQGALDGNPSPGGAVAYPLNGAVLPPNLGPITAHVAKTSSNQNAARLNFSSSKDNVLSVNYYCGCQAAAGPGCYIDLPLEVTQLFIAVSESQNVKMTARLGGTGAPLIETPSINIAWANVPLSGGLYYWTTMADGVVPGYQSPRNVDGTPATGTGIQRYDFGHDGIATPEIVYTDKGRAPTFLGSPPATMTGAQCIGCHAISNDGTMMALTIGGSSDSDFALLNLTTLTMTVLDATAAGGSTSMSDINYYKQFRRAGVATETTWGPNGDVMVNMYKSQLLLHGTSATLANEGPVTPSWGEYKSDPFWSQTGKYLVFTSFAQPDIGTYNTAGLNGDMKRGGQIVIASATATAINDDAKVLVGRENNVTKYYPAISNDDALVVYNQSNCGADPDVYTNLSAQVGVYGQQTCDGYDDSSAALWLTSPSHSQPVRLDVANSGTTPGDPRLTYDNSWPRWSPDNGTFRGQKLYWLAFSSRRPYGLQVNNGTPLSTKPQIWFAAIVIGSELFGDPSSPPVWLPNQNPTVSGTLQNQVPTGNHVPQWVKVAVPIPG